MRPAGGGGHGPPWQREPERVLNDVRQGKVSLERARTAYGVVVDPEQLAIDSSATTSRRAAMQAENTDKDTNGTG